MESDGLSKEGRLVVLVGSTGSGKSVLMSDIREKFPEVEFVHSFTSRTRRPSHENNSYHFVSEAEFKQGIETGEFLEWAQFGGNFYGTQRKEIEDGLAAGKVMLKEMELQGVRQIEKALKPEEFTTIYIDAGSWEDLEARARARAPISDEDLEKRHQHYLEELVMLDEADFVIKNHNGMLEDAKKEFEKIIRNLL